MLAHKEYGKGKYSKLLGNQYYSYGQQYSTLTEYENARKYLYYRRDTEMFCVRDLKEQCMVKDGYTYFKGMSHKELGILSFDIETSGLERDGSSFIYLISNTFRLGGVTSKRLFCFDEYKSQGEMLTAWCEWVRAMDPSLVMGHNIYGYDLPYIRHVADMFNVELKLGRDKSPILFDSRESHIRYDANRKIPYFRPSIYGREIVDTMVLSMKYDVQRKFESYGLKPIIRQLKLEDANRVFYDAMTIKDNIHIPEERIKIKAYCVDDADDCIKLYDLMIPQFFYANRSIPKSLQSIVEGATGSQVNSIMVRSYLQNAHGIAKGEEKTQYQGAYSFGIPGIYRNCFKVDVKSEYPSCILQYNVYNPIKDPNANFYKMVEFFTNERFVSKAKYKETGDKYYSDLEQSQKLFINSAYGLLGTGGLNYNCMRSAAIVTEKGRETLNTATLWLSGHDCDYWVDKAGKSAYDEDREVVNEI
jgi:DNA polymerase elongation subunit (family B)